MTEILNFLESYSETCKQSCACITYMLFERPLLNVRLAFSEIYLNLNTILLKIKRGIALRTIHSKQKLLYIPYIY